MHEARPHSWQGHHWSVVSLACTGWLWLLCACGGSDAAQAPSGTLSGTIHYEGAAAAPGRPLAIAVYTSFPPRGAPLATQLIERYELPYAYAFTDLPPSNYFVGALIDVDRMDTRYAGMLNRTRDPYGYAGGGSPVRLDAQHGALGADILLKEGAQ